MADQLRLRPCPFCGESPWIEPYTPAYVQCACGARGPGRLGETIADREHLAAEAWNAWCEAGAVAALVRAAKVGLARIESDVETPKRKNPDGDLIRAALKPFTDSEQSKE
jgi:hypothetical protein